MNNYQKEILSQVKQKSNLLIKEKEKEIRREYANKMKTQVKK